MRLVIDELPILGTNCLIELAIWKDPPGETNVAKKVDLNWWHAISDAQRFNWANWYWEQEEQSHDIGDTVDW